jgi:hypothetical protein
MSGSSQRASKGALTEQRVAEELGIDRIEIYLLASKHKLGHFDSVTHLLTFTEGEVEELAARLGIDRRKSREAAAAEHRSIPDPNSE